jgi:hypothetical protein
MPIFTLEHYLPHDSAEAQAWVFVEWVCRRPIVASPLTHSLAT